MEGKTKDEVLKNLCRKVEQEKGLPETFTASVLKREELTPTDYGNLVALPHPERAFQERAFVAVAVLKEPIFLAPAESAGRIFDGDRKGRG